VVDPIETAGEGPPPCELSYVGHLYDHPRYPSGDCVVCGALCTEDCKHPLYIGWEYEQTGEYPKEP
jgi:hypothetical protein